MVLVAVLAVCHMTGSIYLFFSFTIMEPLPVQRLPLAVSQPAALGFQVECTRVIAVIHQPAHMKRVEIHLSAQGPLLF